MIDKINDLLKRVEAFKPQAAAEVEEFRVRMLGRKGEMNDVFEEFKKVAPELKKELGQKINALKTRINDKIAEMKSALENTETDSDAAIDMTRPGSNDPIGSRHPISLVRNEIVDIFARLGYTVAEGPEIEDDWHVFSALNFPPEHPARDMQDTFFIRKNPDILLRTHTSSIQVRTMERQKPPIRVVCPGRVFRNEAISYRAHCIFHQVEGLYIDENVSVRRPETEHSVFRQGDVRRKGADPDAPVVLPVHRAVGRSGRVVQLVRRQRMQRMQTYRLARNHGLRDGRSERARSVGHRPATVFGLRIRHGS